MPDRTASPAHTAKLRSHKHGNSEHRFRSCALDMVVLTPVNRTPVNLSITPNNVRCYTSSATQGLRLEVSTCCWIPFENDSRYQIVDCMHMEVSTRVRLIGMYVCTFYAPISVACVYGCTLYALVSASVSPYMFVIVSMRACPH